MDQHSRHPVAALPHAPARESSPRMWLRAYAIFVIFMASAMSAVNNLAGPVGVAMLLGVACVATVIIWILVARSEPARALRFNWRRLPWATLGYVALAAASILWSLWPTVSAETWFALAATTLHGLFLAYVLTWREIVRVLTSALRWILGLSLLCEAYVAIVLRHPVLPPFLGQVEHPTAELYWIRGNLLGSGRIQGIVGNAALLGMLCVLALVVFAVALAARTASLGWSVPWFAVTLFLLWRASTATAFIAAVIAVAVAVMVLVMRATRHRGRWYLIFAAIAVAGVVAARFLEPILLRLLGRKANFSDRQQIWDQVWERGTQRPVFGNGFATPWLPWDPHFDRWIIDHGLTVFHAHNMWLDVFMQLGVVGVIVVGVIFLAFALRSWFFAIDRPRWDLDAARPYSMIPLLPVLVATILIVQGFSESRPLMEWGWLLAVLLATKIKLSPIVGVGAGEQRVLVQPRSPRRT